MAAGIGMEDQTIDGRPVYHAMSSARHAGSAVIRLVHGPTNDGPADQVQRPGKVQPAFAG